MRTFERNPDIRLGRKIVNLIRIGFINGRLYRGNIPQVAVQKSYFVFELRQAHKGIVAGTPDKTVNFVTFSHKQLGQIRTVLAGNTRN